MALASNHEGIHPEDKYRRCSKKDRQFISVSRPAVERQYNKNMGWVDLLDRMLSFYRTSARMKKWTVRVMLHMLDVAATNCWIEYKMEMEKCGLGDRKSTLQMMEFKLRLAEQLIQEESRMDHSTNRSMTSVDDTAGPLGCQQYSYLACPRVPVLPVRRRQEEAKTHPEMDSGKESYHRCRLDGCRQLARVRCHLPCVLVLDVGQELLHAVPPVDQFVQLN